jgi:TetR/AcrR family transcriptional regulator, cholesterol catabolism regulator
VTSKSKATMVPSAGASEAKAPRRNNTRKREREIIDVAAGIFHRQGYADTSVQDVADAVGILKGSLYYYIDSKEDLLFRVLEEVHEDAHAIVEEVGAMDAPPLERLGAYLRKHVAYNTNNLTKVAVYYHDFGLLSPDRREVIIEQRRVYERFVIGLIREAQEEGAVSPLVDAKLAAYSVLGMANWVYTWYSPKGKTSPSELASLIADLIVGGLEVVHQGDDSNGAAPRRVPDRKPATRTRKST